jgi:hypothetical protein
LVLICFEIQFFLKLLKLTLITSLLCSRSDTSYSSNATGSEHDCCNTTCQKSMGSERWAVDAWGSVGWLCGGDVW